MTKPSREPLLANGSRIHREPERGPLGQEGQELALIGKTDLLAFYCQTQKSLVRCSDGQTWQKENRTGGGNSSAGREKEREFFYLNRP